MKQNNIIIAIIGLLIILGVIWSLNDKTEKKETFKIGFSIPLTGNMAFAGESIKIAAQIAKEDFGQTKFNYELIFEDDGFVAEKTASVANKLINVDKVKAIVSFGGTGGNIVGPIAENSKIIHFGVTTDLNVAKGDYNFIHFTLPAEQTKAFISELQKRKIKKIAYLTLNSPGYLATEEDVKNNLASTNIKIVSEQKINIGEKDFRAYISKARLTDPDILVLGAQSPELDILTQQIKEAGVKIPITSINSFEVSKNSSLYEGQWYIGSAAPNQDFVDKFTQKAGYSPTFGAANIYDIVSLIIAGAEKNNKSPTQTQLLEQIKEIKDFPGALGILNFNPDGSVISQAAVKIIKDGKPMVIVD